MAGPWERFQQPAAPDENRAGPWTRYGDVPAAVRNDDLLSEARVLSGGLIEGIPIAGPIIRGAVDRAAALTLAPFSEMTYGEILKEIQETTRKEKEENPILDTAAQVTGAVAGTIPMVAAAPTMFGAGGGSLLTRSLASAGSGGALAAGDAAVRSGGDLDAMVDAGKWGIGLGAAGPTAGHLAGKAVAWGANKLKNAPTSAQGSFARALDADAVDDLAGSLRAAGPDAMPMDLGPNLQRQAGAIAATPGRGQEIVRSAVADRQAGAGGRVTEALTKAIGRPVDAIEAAEDIITARAAAAKPAYEAAYEAGEKAIWSSELERLTASPSIKASMRGAVNVWQDRAIADGFGAMNPGAIVEKGGQLRFSGKNLPAFPNLQFWDYTKRILDDRVRTAMRAGQTQKAATLGKLANQLRDELDKAVPAYKAARDAFAGPSAILDALEEGQSVFTSNVTPGQLRIRLGRMTEGEREAFQQGARAQIAKLMGTARNDALAARTAFEKDWNVEKLRTLIGDEQADDMLRVLRTETGFTKTRDVVTGNSETAARLAAKEETGGMARRPGLLRSAFNMRFGDAIAGVGDRVIGGVRSAAQSASNEELARLLTSRDPDAIERTISMINAARRRGDIAQARAQELVQAVVLGGAPQIGAR